MSTANPVIPLILSAPLRRQIEQEGEQGYPNEICGILIGRALTERPDLFAATIVNVGCTDMLRTETTTNGVPNIPEFGTVTTLEGFKGLYEMSAYAHVKDGVKYPAVLLTHGINDPRVEPWQSAKYAARMQAASASGRPVLLRIEYDAGHGFGSTRRQRNEELADTYYVGWRAFVDGAEAPILRANHAFKAVQIGPGRHVVRFVFEPQSFRLGAMLSGVGLALVVVLLGWSGVVAWRGKAPHPPTPSPVRGRGGV